MIFNSIVNDVELYTLIVESEEQEANLLSWRRRKEVTI